MKRQKVSACSKAVFGLAIAVTLSAGCQVGVRLPVVASVSNGFRSFAARVSDIASTRGRLLPFSINGTRRFAASSTPADRPDPLRQTNDSLANVLGHDHELVQALANRSDWQAVPFALAPLPVKPQQAPSEVEDSRPIQPAEVTPKTAPVVIAEEPAAEAELPSAETFPSGEQEVESADQLPATSKTSVTGQDNIGRDKAAGEDQPQATSEEERLREERIQQLLDLLAKAESDALGNIPELPATPIIERPIEAEPKKIEPLLIPKMPEAPKEIVLRATATMPYQSVRSERVELLNVQQMAPTIPARPGSPAVVRSQPDGQLPAPGWVNSDWSKGLVPDFSALGDSAPQSVDFAPLPPTERSAENTQPEVSRPSDSTAGTLGKLIPELDSNPATAARPIQGANDRR